MNRVKIRIVLFLAFLSVLVFAPFMLFNGKDISAGVDEISSINIDEKINDSGLYSNKDEDLVINNIEDVKSDHVSPNQTEDVKILEDSSAFDDGITTYTIRVVFYTMEYDGCKAFTNSEIHDLIVGTSAVDDNDNVYSVKEYFRDVSFGKVNLEFSYGTREYNPIESPYYANLEYDITINWYPIYVNTYPHQFWASCAGLRSVVLNRSSDISTACHEIIHTFGVGDKYSHKQDNVGSVFVGGWDIMCFNHYLEPQFPTVDTISHITELSQSNYFDLQTSNIEVLDSTSIVSLTASSYASVDDTIAIKISAKDLGYVGDYYNMVYFMIEYRKPNGIKDRYNPYSDDCLIVYRINNNFYSNVHVSNQARTQMYVYRKYNSESVQNAGLAEGDTFGFKTNQQYNTIFMPNGDNTGIVISDIKFNGNGKCTFKVELPRVNDGIAISGKLNNSFGAIANCQIFADDELVGETDSNGGFYIITNKNAIIKFVKDEEVLKTIQFDKSVSNLILYSDNNVCNIIIKNSTASVYVIVNEVAQEFNSTNFEILLNIGDKVVIGADNYSAYGFIYNGQKQLEIYLSDAPKENIVNRAVNNITTNFGKIKDAFENLWSQFF